MLGRVLSLLRRRTPTPAAPSSAPALAPSAAPSSRQQARDTDDFQLPFDIRPKTAADNDSLRTLFRASVLQLGQPYYDAEALAAWAASADDTDFCAQLDQGTTLIAELYGEVAGFAQLHPHDTIRMLYLAPQAAGLGIAVLLYQHLEDEARLAGTDTLHSNSSLAAERFFSAMGFIRDSSETVTRQGQPLSRYRMHKSLRQNQTNSA